MAQIDLLVGDVQGNVARLIRQARARAGSSPPTW